jgi:hypothetical protein
MVMERLLQPDDGTDEIYPSAQMCTNLLMEQNPAKKSEQRFFFKQPPINIAGNCVWLHIIIFYFWGRGSLSFHLSLSSLPQIWAKSQTQFRAILIGGCWVRLFGGRVLPDDTRLGRARSSALIICINCHYNSIIRMIMYSVSSETALLVDVAVVAAAIGAHLQEQIRMKQNRLDGYRSSRV